MKTAIITITNVVFLLQFVYALEQGREASLLNFADLKREEEHHHRSL